MSTEPGRNDPCPCGSGKKYKHCCGAGGPAARRVSIPDEAVAHAIQFIARSDWEAALRAARQRFFAPLMALTEAKREALWVAQPELQGLTEVHFFEWFLADSVEPVSGRNPIEEYLRRRGWQETPAGRAWLQGLREHRLSLYEVQRITPGEGMVLQDLLRERPPCRVIERSASQALRRWDRLVTRIVPLAGERLLSGAGLHFPRAAADQLSERLRAERAESGATDWDELLRDAGPRFMAAYLDGFIHPPPPPKLTTMDGEPLTFASQRFDYPPARRASLVAALAAHAAMQQDDEGHFVWLSAAAEGDQSDRGGLSGQRVLGSITLRNDHGTLETKSRARLERGRALLASLFSSMSVTFKPAVFEDPWKMVEQRSRKPRKVAAEAVPAQNQETLQRFLDQHYRAWCDQPLPALRGQTPRQAVQTEPGQAAVIALLKDFENQESCRTDAEPYDFRWLWGELGLVYPDENAVG